MLLKTKHLTIRPVMETDWQAIQAIWQCFNASEYAQYDRPHATGDDEVRLRVARWAEANHGMAHLFFAVCLKGTLIGYIAFNQRDKSYETGYCFHSSFHGHGYAKESFSALLDYLGSLGITHFTAGTALANTPSVALLHSLGFRQTAIEKVSFYQNSQGQAIVFDGGIFELIR